MPATVNDASTLIRNVTVRKRHRQSPLLDVPSRQASLKRAKHPDRIVRHRGGIPMNKKLLVSTLSILAMLDAFAALAQNADSRMSFFITSVGPGDGANLGGLAGADAHCQKLADAVGAGNKTWRAYLSSTGQGGVNARDRIGSGPWHNAKGVQVASDVDDLHSDQNKLSKENSTDEKGEVVNGRGDDPNRHDILTGSELDGTAFSGDEDTTCGNWTSNGEGSARVGHHDRNGMRPVFPILFWDFP